MLCYLSHKIFSIFINFFILIIKFDYLYKDYLWEDTMSPLRNICNDSLLNSNITHPLQRHTRQWLYSSVVTTCPLFFYAINFLFTHLEISNQTINYINVCVHMILRYNIIYYLHYEFHSFGIFNSLRLSGFFQQTYEPSAGHPISIKLHLRE